MIVGEKREDRFQKNKKRGEKIIFQDNKAPSGI